MTCIIVVYGYVQIGVTMAKVARELLFLGAVCLMLQLVVCRPVDDAAAADNDSVDTEIDAADDTGAVDEANRVDDVEKWLKRSKRRAPDEEFRSWSEEFRSSSEEFRSLGEVFRKSSEEFRSSSEGYRVSGDNFERQVKNFEQRANEFVHRAQDFERRAKNFESRAWNFEHRGKLPNTEGGFRPWIEKFAE